MNINLFFETILLLLAILVSNGFIYSLTLKKNSSTNISVIANSSEKDGLALTSLIASNPIRLTSSESSASQTLSTTSSERNAPQEILDFIEFVKEDISEVTHTERRYFSSTNEVIFPSDVLSNTPSLDSITVLDAQTYEQ